MNVRPGGATWHPDFITMEIQAWHLGHGLGFCGRQLRRARRCLQLWLNQKVWKRQGTDLPSALSPSLLQSWFHIPDILAPGASTVWVGVQWGSFPGGRVNPSFPGLRVLARAARSPHQLTCWKLMGDWEQDAKIKILFKAESVHDYSLSYCSWRMFRGR